MDKNIQSVERPDRPPCDNCKRAWLSSTDYYVTIHNNGIYCSNYCAEKSIGTTPEQGAVKFDEGKPRMDLIPPEIMVALGTILHFGSVKYAERNWEKGMSWGRCFGACMRHMWAWWGGRLPTDKSFLFGDLDMETGKSHLWHASCCIAFLIAYEARGVGEDDRGS